MFSSIFKRSFSRTAVRFDTLTLIESTGSKISPSSLSAITAATQLGEPVTGLIAGPGGDSIASEVSKVSGLDKIIHIKGDQFDHYLAEELAPVIKQVMESSNYSHFLTASSAVGKSVLPRIGALMDSQPISDIIKIQDNHTFVRPIYAGNALATVKCDEKLLLTSIRPSAFPPAQLTDNTSVPIEELTPSIDSGNRTQFVSENLLTSERPELGSATKVVAGGRGLKNKETFDKLIDPLALKLNAAIGASRAAVDSGFCDNSLQVGQTGKIVAPDLYIAVGISGAIQHLAGMKDAKTIVAINKDPEAAIFNVADLGLVADLNEAVPDLTEKI